MNLEKIHKCMKSMRDCENRPIFHSEKDFVLTFAWSLHKEFDFDIRMEYSPYEDKNLYLDIWCWCSQSRIAIEMKYKTQPFELKCCDEFFHLKDHPVDVGRYDFIRDIERLEEMVGNSKVKVEFGFAIILTNDRRYWDSDLIVKGTKDEKFRIHECSTLPSDTPLSWGNGSAHLKTKERSKRITLRHSYKLDWSCFKKFGDEKNAEFKYLVVPVEKH